MATSADFYARSLFREHHLQKRKDILFPAKVDPVKLYQPDTNLLDQKLVDQLRFAIEHNDDELIKQAYKNRAVQFSRQRKDSIKGLPLIQQAAESHYFRILFAYHYKKAALSMKRQKRISPLHKILPEEYNSIRYYIGSADEKVMLLYLKRVTQNREALKIKKDHSEQKIHPLLHASEDGDAFFTSFLPEHTQYIINTLEKNKELIGQLFQKNNLEKKAQTKTTAPEEPDKLSVFLASLTFLYKSYFDRYTKDLSPEIVDQLLSFTFLEAFKVFVKKHFEQDINMASRINAWFSASVSKKVRDPVIHTYRYQQLEKNLEIKTNSFEILFTDFVDINVKNGRPQYITPLQFKELFINFIQRFPTESVQIVDEFLLPKRLDLIPNFLTALKEVREKKNDESATKNIETLVNHCFIKFANYSSFELDVQWCGYVREDAQRNLGFSNHKIKDALHALGFSQEKSITLIQQQEKEPPKQKPAPINQGSPTEYERLRNELTSSRSTLSPKKPLLIRKINEELSYIPANEPVPGCFSSFFFPSKRREIVKKNQQLVFTRNFLNSLKEALELKNSVPSKDGFEQYQELFNKVTSYRIEKAEFEALQAKITSLEDSQSLTPS